MSRKPLCVDGYCGLGGWSEGFLAEGWDCVGIDIERHQYGEHKYPCDLILADMRTIHGSQFKDADCFAMSPPCQFFSYTAMPWSRAKALAAKVRTDPALLEKELELFNACFRIQREACEAAGRHIPLVVENVRGAEPWVGRARWNWGSFYLWGDVPALMPPVTKARKVPGFRFDGSGKSFQSASVAETGVKAPGMNWSDRTKRGQDFTRLAGRRAMADNGRKQPGINLSEIGFNVANAHTFGSMVEGVKIVRSERDKRDHIGTKRKFASAMIAKIPVNLSRHVAKVYFP